MLAGTSRAEERQVVKNTLLSLDVVTIRKPTAVVRRQMHRGDLGKHQVAQVNQEQKAMASICIVCVQC